MIFCPGQFVVTWNEEHNHASNEEGFKQRKAKTDLINAIFTSGLMIENFDLTHLTREDFYRKRKTNAHCTTTEILMDDICARMCA